MKRALLSSDSRLLLRWLFALCFVLPMPRLMVHSHASVVEMGGGCFDLDQHLEQYHTGAQDAIDFFTFHFHWTYTPSQDPLLADSSSYDAIPLPDKFLALSGEQLDCGPQALLLSSHCLPEFERSRCPFSVPARTFFAAPARVQFCVWNC